MPQAPPQRASGDFDGDGRVDSALIQEDAGDRRIAVRLSGSPAVIRLEASVAGVIESDVDRDGDLDLVAATSSGEVMIWLNDGHGRFTRQAPSKPRGVSGAPVVVQHAWPDAVAVGARPPVLPVSRPVDRILAVAPARAATIQVRHVARSLIPPALRAPPALV